MKVFQEDLEQLSGINYIPWDKLQEKTILVTGATGLIGYTLVCALLHVSEQNALNLKVIALVRNKERAMQKYAELMKDGCNLTFVEGHIERLPFINEEIHYIVHGASQTASAAFIKNPVETINTAIDGTKNILELARCRKILSMVYLSSMEAYGAPIDEMPVSENAGAYFDSMSVRSCYPESKRMCEALCAAYTSEYDVPAKVIRLAQTFGPGVNKDDERVFADFARRALNNEDIVMNSLGDSGRMYLYTMDAVTAILVVMLRGENGHCYNAANKDTYCTIKEMAELVSHVLSGGRSGIKIRVDEEKIKKYSPSHKLRLNTSKLEGIGWNARYSLSEMYDRMSRCFEV